MTRRPKQKEDRRTSRRGEEEKMPPKRRTDTVIDVEDGETSIDGIVSLHLGVCVTVCVFLQLAWRSTLSLTVEAKVSHK